MKNWKYIYSLSICLLTLCFVGCTQDESSFVKTTPQVNEGDPVEITFSVRIPEITSVATKALGETPTDRKDIPLWLVVFDANGYLTEYTEAKWDKDVDENGVIITYFTATLYQTTKERIVHFVANHEIDELAYGHESAVIGQLQTVERHDAYWQRVVFENGFYYEYDDEGEIIGVADEVKSQMSKVPLVRNFAKITVSEELTNFTLVGFTVVNTPDRGSVAPYVTDGKFAEYLDEDNNCVTYSVLSEDQKYSGFIPSGMELENTVDDVFKFDMLPNYLYERKFSNTNSTYVLIEGRYGNNAISYYKIDLGYTADNGLFTHYNLLRNFHYAVKITSVLGDGYKTAAEAAENVAFNNISASTQTQSLLNISDGTHRLFVNFTNKIVVDQSTVYLQYKYVPNYLTNSTPANSSVDTRFVTEGDVIGSAGTAYAGDDGWNIIEIIPNEPDPYGAVKDQSVILYVDGGLSRTINFTLRKPWDLTTVACSPSTNVARIIGTEVTVSFDIPADLKDYMFPLEFKLESNWGNIYNNPQNKDAMVVWYGGSTIPGNEGASVFGFTKLLTYDAYLDLTSSTGAGFKTVVCSFLTNVEVSTSTTTTVYITNPYFTQTSVTFTQS